MDEFVYVLLAGLALIVVAIFVWGGETPSDQILNNTSVVSPFSIGAFPQDVPRHIRIGDFKVSYSVGSEDIKTDRAVLVKKGSFGEDYHTMSVNVDQELSSITTGFVNIDVLDTNSGGNLVVTFNDNKVFDQKVGRGSVEIPIDNGMIKDYNVIEIRTTHPGWEFWKSSVYNIDKVEFGINLWGRTEKTQDFTVYEDELRDFRSGEISFGVDNIEGIGDLVIEVNGRTIYRGEPEFDFHRSFDALEVGLRKGTNTISFSAESGVTYEIDDAEIAIIHEEVGVKKRSFDFQVSTTAYNNLKNKEGKASFKITDTNYNGNLILTITDPEGNVHSTEAIQSYSIGETVSVGFGQSNVKPGKNTLNFEVTGNGNFVIGNVEVTLP